ncbi:MAG: DUF2878 domain-containing protein [Candidatus Nitrotoga sp.]|nr:DUF2878 domain-containing protein [Candidatus Nitrotoga sp.]MBA0902307.1 DUF2878 domain-containing protein [Candidatus Nitrotoga sp.]MBP0116936.1 DUF2878 domain-containing protein [Candidatus Nitrotoga sp.]MBP0126302.1 DUF2878 domain-containing protein [Candidatus Nitrotoga sp.]
MNIFSAAQRVPVTTPAILRVIANFVAFQAGWFACVLGAAHSLPWAGTAFAAVIIVTHVFFAEKPRREIRLIVMALLIGIVWDSTLVMLGWLDFTSGFLLAGVAPHWILALWALFAITLRHSLAWLQAHLFAAAVLGAIAGPLAYWGGLGLGAVILVEPLHALVALSIGWGIFTPLLLRLAREEGPAI